MVVLGGVVHLLGAALIVVLAWRLFSWMRTHPMTDFKRGDVETRREVMRRIYGYALVMWVGLALEVGGAAMDGEMPRALALGIGLGGFAWLGAGYALIPLWVRR